MTLSDLLGLSDRDERLLTRGLQFVLVGIMGYGLVTFRLGMAANGATALAFTLLPAVLRREYDYSMDPGLVLWITVAVFVHSIGSLGPYTWFPWWDNVAHTITSTVVAGIGYASFRAFERHSDAIDVAPGFRVVFILVFVLATGVVWELLEYGSTLLAQYLGMKPPLAVYTVGNTVSDMIFNTIGALIVSVAGTDYFEDLAGFFQQRLET